MNQLKIKLRELCVLKIKKNRVIQSSFVEKYFQKSEKYLANLFVIIPYCLNKKLFHSKIGVVHALTMTF